jgi:hypothetical protein
VTGDLEATLTATDPKTGKMIVSYDLRAEMQASTTDVLEGTNISAPPAAPAQAELELA